MAEVKWIKIVTDIFDDEKVLLIESLPDADSLIVIWFKLLCLSGKQNNSGVFLMNNKIPYTDEMLSAIFRRPLNTVKLALQTFESFGMIEIVNGIITIPKWDKHQRLDQLEMAKEQTRQRVAKHRAKQKLLASGEDKKDNVTDCNVTSNVTVTQSNANRIDKDIDIDKNRIDKEKKIKYGDYNRVELTQTEYNKLCEDFGKDFIDNQITLLDEYVESNNNKNKYKNFNLVLRKSIRENWFNKSSNTTNNNTLKYSSSSKAEMDDLYAMLLQGD
jgi:predicted phage replisome organizer